MITRNLILIGMICLACEVFSGEPNFFSDSPVATATKNPELVFFSDSPVATVTKTIPKLNNSLTPTITITDTFELIEPKVGATLVIGKGTPNVPIRIYEVAKTADLLGELIIPATGNFVVKFPNRPLQENERVGIVLGDLSDTVFEYGDFKSVAIREVPVYGYILDDVKVIE